LSITKENLDLAEKVYQSRKALYAEAVTTLIELLDAERELSHGKNQPYTRP
jgi:outer membrane protein TolC